jgi:hypothetical protein
MTGFSPLLGLAWRPTPDWLVEMQVRVLGSFTGGHLGGITVGFARLF